MMLMLMTLMMLMMLMLIVLMLVILMKLILIVLMLMILMMPMMLMMLMVMTLMLTHCVPLIDLHSSPVSVPHPPLMPRDNPIHTNSMPSTYLSPHITWQKARTTPASQRDPNISVILSSSAYPELLSYELSHSTGRIYALSS